MKFLINKIKYIALVLTLMNLCLAIFGLYEGESKFLIGGVFIAVELAVLLMYLIMVTHNWTNDQTERVNKEYKQGAEKLAKRLSILESSQSEMKDWMNVELKNISLKNSSHFDALGKITKGLLADLSNELSKTGEGFELSLKKTTLEVGKEQEVIRRSIEESSSSFTKGQEKVIQAIDESSSEAEKGQEVIKQSINESTSELTKGQEVISQSINESNSELTKGQEVISQSINESNSGLSKGQGAVIQSIEKSRLEVVKGQEGIIESLEKTNSEVVKGQEEIRQEIDEKYLAHEESLNSISSTTLNNQQDLNKTLEANSQKTTQLSSRILNHIDTKTNNINFNVAKQLNTTYDRIDALMSIHNIIELNAPLPIMHDWRVSSDYAHATLSSLIEKGEGSVIDVGSGISTLLFGYGVKKNGSGKVIALEHSEEYFEKSKALIKLHKLEDYCELYYCPLKEYDLEGEKWLWYDISDIEFPNDITLISVDGPPGGTQYMARYPAVPLMINYITKKTLVYLDDSNREEEKLSVERWNKEFSLKNNFFKSDRGYYLINK